VARAALTLYGYARVSTNGQSLDAQVKQLRAAGAEKIFKETASGARVDRAELRLVRSVCDSIRRRQLLLSHDSPVESRNSINGVLA
jgi:DNA invertase Pin-like site-specific DNA recombinase